MKYHSVNSELSVEAVWIVLSLIRNWSWRPQSEAGERGRGETDSGSSSGKWRTKQTNFGSFRPEVIELKGTAIISYRDLMEFYTYLAAQELTKAWTLHYCHCQDRKWRLPSGYPAPRSGPPPRWSWRGWACSGSGRRPPTGTSTPGAGQLQWRSAQRLGLSSTVRGIGAEMECFPTSQGAYIFI